MVAGVGIGNMMGINGAAAHAFSNILYKGLLFMVAGSVIHMTGKRKLTELGGLYKTMPLTFILCMVAGLSISAFPFFNGFISKSMVVTAAAEEHLGAIWLMLMLASSGTFLSVGLKFTYFIFLGHDCGLRPKEPPLNMLIAMGLAGFLCIFIGVYPYALYKVLPHDIEYSIYTAEHVVWTLQILLFTGLVFFLLFKRVKPKDLITLDTDWFYRKGAMACLRLLYRLIKSKAITRLDPEGSCKKGARAFLHFAQNSIAVKDGNFSNLYINGITNPVLKAADAIWKFFDIKVIDGLVNQVAVFVRDSGERIRQIQTGYVRNYALSMVIGFVVILYFAL
jgi:multicomponent Na+:H+ antiporter subunit D